MPQFFFLFHLLLLNSPPCGNLKIISTFTHQLAPSLLVALHLPYSFSLKAPYQKESTSLSYAGCLLVVTTLSLIGATKSSVPNRLHNLTKHVTTPLFNVCGMFVSHMFVSHKQQLKLQPWKLLVLDMIAIKSSHLHPTTEKLSTPLSLTSWSILPSLHSKIL
jgi:hypothetical protein